MNITESFIERLYRKLYLYKDNIAVVEEESNSITYNDLWTKASSAAKYIKTNVSILNSVDIENPVYVGIRMEKSIDYVVAVLACMINNYPFIPIGIDLPKRRVDKIVADAKIGFVITKDFMRKIPSNFSTDQLKPQPRNLNSIIYAIFSSGSTGSPKGIAIPEYGIMNLVYHQIRAFEVGSHAKFLWLLSNNFDGALSDFFVALSAGGTLVIPKDVRSSTYLRLFDAIKSNGITHIDMPPALLKYFSPKYLPKTLKTIIVGGEAIDALAAKKFADKVNLVSAYGPTEATICTSCCKITAEWPKANIGKPFDGVEYRIVDNELYIGGCQLAKGYLNNSELTKARFVELDGKRYFKTGDKVHIENGDYVFDGRIDRQFKHNGQLVAPEEIEACYKNIGYNTIATLKNGKIVCFIETSDSINKSVLDRIGHKNLAPWMVPSDYIPYAKFPTLPTGKIDYMTLLAVESDVVDDAVYGNSAECKIAHIVKDILNLKNFPEKNIPFKELGGDSINAIVLLSRLHSELGINMTPNDLANNNTIAKIACFNSVNYGYSMTSTELREIAYSKLSQLKNNITTDKHTKAIFITGATGFLGSRLLEELCYDNLYSTIYCLVRADNYDIGLTRLLKSVRLKAKIAAKKIVPVCGNLTEPKFGLDDETYDKIASEVSMVVHCAAEVNVFKTFTELEAVNVNGTLNVLQFCQDKNKKKLYYASTLSVFVSTTKNSGVVYEHDELSDDVDVFGGYGQTKYVSEFMVLNSNVLHGIFRYGLLTPDSSTMQMRPNDFLKLFIVGATKLKYLPYDNTNELAVDITPINYAVVKTILLMDYDAFGIFHITANSPLKLNTLSKILKDDGFIKSTLAYEYWEALATTDEFKNDTAVQACKHSLCRLTEDKNGFMDLFQTTNIKFDDKKTESLIGNNFLFDAKEYLVTLIKYLKNIKQI